MLDRLAPLEHLLRVFIKPSLYFLQEMLMLPADNPPLRSVVQHCFMAQFRQMLVQ